MAKAQIKTADGMVVDIEGTIEEIDKLMTLHGTSKNSEKVQKSISNIAEGIQRLADKCKLSTDELVKTLDIRADFVQLLIPLTCTNAKKQRIMAKCVLATLSEVQGREWIDSKILSDSLERSGIKIDQLPRNLKAESNSFRVKGNGTGTKIEYTLTGPALIASFETIRKLGKGEN